MNDTETSKKALLKILECNTADEVRNLVQNESYFSEIKWLPYGGFANNTGVVNGQMKEAENSLIEKVTNAIDAILMRRCMEEGIDPKDQSKSPKDMEQAIQLYFGGRDEIRKKRSEYAKEMIRITARGKKDKPTITVVDKGEGQTPDSISKTILSLQQDIKKKIRFVYGTYNQGGSSALGFCHDSSQLINYAQLVITRKAPTLAQKFEKDSDCFGFTLVRSRYDEDAGNFTYEYFVDNDEKIPRFSSDSPIAIDGYEFSDGCVIRLFDYQLSSPGNIVFRGLNESIEKKLSYSPLPIFLQELREYRGDTEYTIFGFREKMERLEQKIMHPGFPTYTPVEFGEIGKKDIRIFVLEHKSKHSENIDSYLNQKEKVFFMRNGMTLHSENVNWLREHCGLTDLAPYMFIFIDISEISPALATILQSGREQFKNTPTTRQTLERLKIFLESFKDLDSQYGSLTSSNTEIEDKDLMKQLTKEASKDPDLRKLFDLGNDFPTDAKKGTTQKPYKGDYLPTKFELIGQTERSVEKRKFSRIAFRTDADDSLFLRSEDKGECDWTESENFLVTFQGMNRGIITFRVDSKTEAKIESSSDITFYLKVKSKNISFSQKVNLKLIDSPDYEGEYFPTYFNTVKNKLKIPIGTERKWVLSTDVTDEYFSRSKDKGNLQITVPEKLQFVRSKLSNGFLTIRMKHLGNTLEEVGNVKALIFDNAGHKFEIVTSVEVVPQDYDPNLQLPEPQTITREKWNEETPPFESKNIARIPNWSKFDKIKINMDSIIFDELKQLNLINRDKAREYIKKEIYINSIWLYLELRNLRGANEDMSEIKTEAFDMALRGMRKSILNYVKKSIR